jgi:hypothetical protein
MKDSVEFCYVFFLFSLIILDLVSFKCLDAFRPVFYFLNILFPCTFLFCYFVVCFVFSCPPLCFVSYWNSCAPGRQEVAFNYTALFNLVKKKSN